MHRSFVIRVVAGGIATLAVSALLAAQAVERVLYVSVYDDKTHAPATGLAPDAFVVTEDGVRREVLRVSPATSEMPIAVLVDNTEGATRTIADLRKALSTFFHDVDGVGPVALIGVADRPTILVDYTTDQKTLQDGVGRVFAVPGAGATLLDAIVETSKGLERRSTDRAAIVVVTTENVEFSTRHYRDVLKALDQSGAMMYAVVLTNPNGSTFNDEARNRASVLDLGPGEHGGVRFDVLTSLAYEGRLQEMAAILKNQQRVVYARPDTLIPPRKIEVKVAKDGLDANGLQARGQGAR